MTARSSFKINTLSFKKRTTATLSVTKTLNANRDNIFSNMWSVIKRGTGGLNFLLQLISNRSGKFKLLDLQGDPHLQCPRLVGYPDLPKRKTLRRKLDLFTVMILKIVSESIFFQSNKFIAFKVKDEKNVANSLIVFSLMKIFHPFQVISMEEPSKT